MIVISLLKIILLIENILISNYLIIYINNSKNIIIYITSNKLGIASAILTLVPYKINWAFIRLTISINLICV